jgi:hypothetical protein
VGFGTSIHHALRLAAFEAGDGVATDHVLRQLVALRTDDVRRLLAWVPALAEPVAYGSAASADDGPPPAGSTAAVAFEVEATLHELAWSATRFRPRAVDRLPGATDGLRAALSRTLELAGAHGATRAAAAHFVMAALAGPAHRAVRVYPEARAGIVARLTGDRLLTEDGPGHPRPSDLITRAERDRRRRWGWRLARRIERIGRYQPLWTEIEQTRCRYAVRLQHGTITIAHTVLALIDVEERLTAYDVRLPDRDLRPSTAGRRLIEAGATIDAAVAHARAAGDDVELADPATIRSRLDGRRWNDPLWSRTVVDAEQQAEAIALAAHHPSTGTTHLLAGMLAAAADETGAVLAALGAAGLEDRISLDLQRIPRAW